MCKASVTLVAAAILAACTSAQEHRAAVTDNSGDRITVGTVQREIRVGMTNADVVSVLGSPNIVTTDDQRREQWVYDKVSTDTVYSSSQGGISTLFLGGGPAGAGILGGLGGGGYSSSAGAKTTTQRTLTIVIKFDEKQLVRDFSYRTSSF